MILTNDWDTMPRVIANHVWTSERLSNLLHNVSPRTLVIYSHRTEHTRFNFAAIHVLDVWCKKGLPKPIEAFANSTLHSPTLFSTVANDGCTIREENLIPILKKRSQEMEMGNNKLLTCGTYASIEENAPNLSLLITLVQVRFRT